MPPAARDQQTVHGTRKMLRPAHHSSRGRSRQRGGGVGVGQRRHRRKKPVEVIAIQRFWRNLEEVSHGQKPRHHPRIDPARQRQCPTLILRHTQPCQHQVIDRRIGRPGVKRQQRPCRLRQGHARVNPGHIANPAQIDQRQWRNRPDEPRTGMMEKRHQRRTLPAHFHICRAEIPHHRHTQRLRQQRTIPGLMGAPALRIMRQRLAMKPHHIHARKPRHDLQMGQFHHFRRLSHPRLTVPAAKRRPDHRPLCR